MKPIYIYIALVVVVIGGLILVKNSTGGRTDGPEAVTAFDSFAQCLGDAGAKFYGAYWCPHCQAQKKLFDNSKKIPYIECSTPNGQGQTPFCIEAGITGYPTWEFIDGSRLDGQQSLQALSDKTNCQLPTT